MLLDETSFKAFFPNLNWQGNEYGSGVYDVDDHVVCTHGHQFDFFNAPNPHTSKPLPAGSILPPGYFIARTDATKLKDGIYSKKKPHLTLPDPLKQPFYAAFDLIFESHFHYGHDDMKKVTITCNGIDGFEGANSIMHWRDQYMNLNLRLKFPPETSHFFA